MKLIIKKIALTLCITVFPLSVGYADKLTVPAGDTLDLGESVELWNAQDSRLGQAVKKEIEMMEKDGKRDVLPNMIAESFPLSDRATIHYLSKQALKSLEVYQIRSAEEGAFHQGFLMTFSLPHKEMTDGEKIWKAIGAVYRLKDTDNPSAQLMGAKEIVFNEQYAKTFFDNVSCRHMYVGEKTKKIIKNKKSGKKYEVRTVQLAIDTEFFFFPLFVETIETCDKKERGYLFLITNQSSASYFSRLLKNSLKGKKYEAHQ